MAGICFECGKRLKDAVGREVPGVERHYHGATVRMHKVCASRFDSGHVTARAITQESGETYADDGAYSPLRYVYRRHPGGPA